MDDGSKEIRKRAFLQLKPACIAVNQFALEKSSKSGKALTHALSNLLRVLSGLTYLDSKLSEYVFFPLSHVFRETIQVPARATELALECLLVLLRRDWGSETGSDLVEQILILLGSFLDKESSSGKCSLATEEITENVLKCLESLFTSIGACQPGEERRLNVLGYVISGILDYLVESRSPKIQYPAISALRAFVSSASGDTLQNFLPGIVSTLAKVLKYNGSTRTPTKVLIAGLSTLERTLRKSLGDVPADEEGRDEESEKTKDLISSTSDGWQQTNAEQIRIALAGVFKLRRLPNVDVLRELERLCTSVCVRCKSSLHSSRALSLETLIAISGHEEIRRDGNELGAIRLLLNDESLMDLFKTLAYEWLSALPRIILSTESSIRAAGLGQVLTTYEILQALGTDMELLNRSLVTALIESTEAILRISRPAQIREIQESNPHISRQLMISSPQISRSFESLPSIGSDQAEILAEFQATVRQVFGAGEAHELRKLLCEEMPNSGSDRLAMMWLLSTSVPSAATAIEFSDLIDFPAENKSHEQQIPDSAYSDCLDILTTTGPDVGYDWRSEAMALQIIAFRSQEDGLHFRPELIDVLYPVVERIGAENSFLREYAFTALNLIASSCGFENAGHLIVENVDYLVNSIALKFNTFELNPQTPYVLSMMIEMCGPKLIPYLDDLVESIFSVLASFHGYPRLVEPLFMVLESVVKQGKLAHVDDVDKPTDPLTSRIDAPISVSDALTLIRQRLSYQKSNRRKQHNSADDPREPDDEFNLTNPANDFKSQNSALATTAPKSAHTKTRTMVHSILSLTQHHLTNPSPQLRHRLLGLTSTGCSTALLSSDPDSFLPLVHAIWPVVVQRLHDPEFYVCIAAADTIAAVVAAAGDFMTSRVADLWLDIRGLCRRTRDLVDAERARERRASKMRTTAKTKTKTKPEPAPETQANRTSESITGPAARHQSDSLSTTTASQTWASLRRMLLTLIQHVRIDAAMQDELMDLLSRDLATRPDVRAALEMLNPDVVWLEMQRLILVPEVETEAKAEVETEMEAEAEAEQARRRVPPRLEGFRFAEWQV